LAIFADPAPGASRAATTAIIEVCVEVDAGARAGGLTAWAIEYALAIGADLAGNALIGAFAAMIEVAFGIDA
jgi:hypothetical protein